MIVIVLSVVPPKLRGHLTRWLFEIAPGVYVGKVSARVRDLLWEQVLENCGANGKAIMVYPTNNEQGMEFRTRGHDWQPVDYDGLELIMRPNTTQRQQRDGERKSQRKTGWSKASQFRRFGR